MSNSSAAAQQIARTLVASSVTDVVIAPGSRSAPLIYALAPLAEVGLIRTHVRIDERDAGFLALGLARGLRAARGREAGASSASGAVAVVTTSGSAVANLHPAILEASYGHLPLIAITADRPARLRGTGANQTIDDQSRVLSDVRARFDVPALGGNDSHSGGEHARQSDVGTQLAEAVVRAVGDIGGVGQRASGPVQFNVQFDVPLVPSAEELAAWKRELEGMRREPGSEPDTGDGPDKGDGPAATLRLRITDGTVIVGGDAGGHTADSLRRLAEAHGLPVLAEPSSPLSLGMGGSRTFVPAHAEVLSRCAELREAVDTVIVHGKPTLTRPVAALLADAEVQVQRLPDEVDALSLQVEVAADAGEGGLARPDRGQWLRRWTEAGKELRARSAGSDSPARAVTERLAASPITLFVASSNSVRYLSEVTEVRADIHASRGLAGIDGLVSTATGLSLGLGKPVVLLIGDVAMLHDVGGLLTPSGEEVGDVTIVILNDDGGAIFSGLEHSQDHVADYLERYFTVPHGRRFDALAAAFDWDYARADDADAVIAEIERPGDGGPVRRIVEVVLGD